MTAVYSRPEPLRDEHVLDTFECRSSEQTPEFEDSPTDPLHLVLLVKDIRRTLLR